MAIRAKITITLTASAMAAAATAHTGATGVVLDRMNGMTAIRDIVAELAPMMQGTVPYDAFTVSEGARVISSHAGEKMLSLFPEDSLEGVTYARSEIWESWQDFASLAEDLEIYADALSAAAPNGLQPAENMAAMDHSAMAAQPAPPAEKVFTIAELMGYAENPGKIAASRAVVEPTEPALDLTTLAADDLFNRISGTCSSCHAQFRAGRS